MGSSRPGSKSEARKEPVHPQRHGLQQDEVGDLASLSPGVREPVVSRVGRLLLIRSSKLLGCKPVQCQSVSLNSITFKNVSTWAGWQPRKVSVSDLVGLPSSLDTSARRPPRMGMGNAVV